MNLNKLLVIIRTCPKDDYISYLCYQSWKKVLPNATVIFFAEDEGDIDQYKWIPQTDCSIIMRPFCDNFGGRSNVITCVEWLKKIYTAWYDYIAFCDADITLLKNPFDEYFDFGGVKDVNNPRHYSGQLLLFKQGLFNDILHYDKYEELYEQFINENISILDDTIFSYLATEGTDKVRDFYKTDYWRHEKLHNLEPK